MKLVKRWKNSFLLKRRKKTYDEAYLLQKDWMKIEKEIFNLEKIQKNKGN